LLEYYAEMQLCFCKVKQKDNTKQIIVYYFSVTRIISSLRNCVIPVIMVFCNLSITTKKGHHRRPASVFYDDPTIS